MKLRNRILTFVAVIVFSLVAGFATGEALHKFVYQPKYVTALDLVIPGNTSDGMTTSTDTVRGIIKSNTFNADIAKALKGRDQLSAGAVSAAIEVETTSGSQLLTTRISTKSEKCTKAIAKQVSQQINDVVVSSLGKNYEPKHLTDVSQLPVVKQQVSRVKLDVISILIYLAFSTTVSLSVLLIKNYRAN